MSRPLRIFTVVWGPTHIDWFRRALCKSLSWPMNKKALAGATWTIYGDQSDTQSIYEAATQIVPFSQIELKPKSMDKGQVDLLSCFMQSQRMCLLEKASLIIAPPDTIFGEGSIQALVDYGGAQDNCVFVPHPRVCPSIIGELTREPMTNAQLVKLCTSEKHAHKCWTTANSELSISGTTVGGVRWTKLEENLWSVQHRLPTPYLCNFIDEDRKFFSKSWKGVQPQFGMLDHEWSGAEIIPRERQRYIGSSDVAFICEITEEHKNIPTQKLVDVKIPDLFHRDEYHNQINRQYLYTMRGE